MDEPLAQPRRSPWSYALRAALIVGLGALIALLAWGVVRAGEGRGLVARIAAGERPPAPSFELEVIWTQAPTWPPELRPALADGRLALDELQGYPVVLNIWASWCIPCREEAPILAASAAAHTGEVVFLGVDVQDLRGDALAFLREFDVPFASMRDRENQVYDAYGLTGVPETYFIDAGGRIVSHSPGPVIRESLEAGVRSATTARP